MPVFILCFSWLLPSLRRWGDGREWVQSPIKTEDEAKVMAQQMAGLTHTIEDNDKQLCNTETLIDAVAGIDQREEPPSSPRLISRMCCSRGRCLPGRSRRGLQNQGLSPASSATTGPWLSLRRQEHRRFEGNCPQCDFCSLGRRAA